MIAKNLFAAFVFSMSFVLLTNGFANDTDKPNILGEWDAPVVIHDGKEESEWNHQFRFEKEHVLIKRSNQKVWQEEYRYTIDESKSPHEITMVGIDMVNIETGEPQKLNAIFEHSTKGLRIAFLPGKNGSSLSERPKDFSSTTENHAIVMILRRSPNQSDDK